LEEEILEELLAQGVAEGRRRGGEEEMRSKLNINIKRGSLVFSWWCS